MLQRSTHVPSLFLNGIPQGCGCPICLARHRIAGKTNALRLPLKKLSLSCLSLLVISFLLSTISAFAQTRLVISQMYGGGGNSGAPYTYDFLELYNPTGSSISLAGYSVQYAAATSASWNEVALPSVSVAAGHYFLIQAAAGTTVTGINLPVTPDFVVPATGSTGNALNFSATAGKVGIVANTTPLTVACPASSAYVDLIGYGATANCYEGTGPAPAPSNTTTDIRTSLTTDNINNATDFSTGTPTPHNSGSSSTPVTVAIHTIQGSRSTTTGGTTTYAGQQVITTGVVTSVLSNAFFIQSRDVDADADPTTPEGIQVFTGSGKVPSTAVLGNYVQVTGTVSIYPAVSASHTPASEITSPTVTLISTGNALPTPISLTTAMITPSGGLYQLTPYEGMRVTVPSLTAVSGTTGTISSANEPTETATSNGYFYAVITGTSRPFREPGIDIRDTPIPGEPANIAQFDDNPERILVDSVLTGGASIEISTGAVLTNVTGVLDFTFSNDTYYDPSRLLLDASYSRSNVATGMTVQPVPLPASTEFTVASFNIERFYNINAADDLYYVPAGVNGYNGSSSTPIVSTGQTFISGAVDVTQAAYTRRLQKLSLAIRNVLNTPDIVTLEEVENQSVANDIANQINTDAGVANLYTAYSTDNSTYYSQDGTGISVGFLVKNTVDKLGFTQYGALETFTPNLPANSNLLTLNDRPWLVLNAGIKRANAKDYPVTVIVNHMKALTGENSTTSTSTRQKKELQAEDIAKYIQTLQAAGQHVISGGDFNAFEFSDGYTDTLGTYTNTNVLPASQVVQPGLAGLVTPPLVDMALLLSADQRWSYQEDGSAQILDHLVVTPELVSAGAHMAYAHMNADFPLTAYNDATTPARNSDHDVAVGYFTLPAPVLSATLTPASADFGSNNVGVPSTGQVFTLTNTGEASISITSIAAAVGASSASYGNFGSTSACGSSLGIGATCTVNVVFTGTAGGSASGTLTAVTSAGTYTSNLTATGIAPAILTASPTSLSFPLTVSGFTSASLPVTIANPSSTPQPLFVGIGIYSAANPFTQTNNCGSSVPAKSSCIVNVFFAPNSLTSGTATGNLVITGGTYTALVTVPLSGSYSAGAGSVAPATTTFASAVVSQTSLSPETVVFTAAATVGLVTPTITQEASDFKIVSTTCTTSLSSGQSCSATLSLTPTDIGTRNGQITFSTPQKGSFSAQLVGRGLTPGPPSVSPATLTFPSTALTIASPSQTVTVTGDSLPRIITAIAVAPFQITSTTCSSTVPLAAGSTCSISVDFVPTTTGPALGTLIVTGTVDAAAVTTQVQLTGTGTASLTVNPTSITFPMIGDGGISAAIPVTLTNHSATPQAIASISTSAALTPTQGSSNPFSQTNNCGSIIAANSSCTINLVFSPNVGGGAQPTTFSGSLIIQTTGSSAATLTVPLTGPSTYSSGTVSSPPYIDFGSTTVGLTSATQLTFTFTAIGHVPGVTPVIVGVIDSGDFKLLSTTCASNQSLGQGQSCTATVVFTPTATGFRQGELQFEAFVEHGTFLAPFTGTGVAPAAPSLSVTSLTFPGTPINTISSSQTVVVTNNSTVPLNMTGSISGAFVYSQNLSTTCYGALAVGSSCSVSVQYAPTTAGASSGVLTVTGVINQVSVSSTVNLTGTGIAPTPLIANPTSLTFPTTANYDTSTLSVTLTNPTSTPQQFATNGISFSGGPYLSQSNNCGLSIGANSSCTITVAFNPTTNTIGTTGGNLIVQTAGASVAPLIVPITADYTIISGYITLPSGSFHNTVAGAISPTQLTYTLTAIGSITVNSVSLSDSYNFKVVSTTCSGGLSNGQTCSATVAFTPISTGSLTSTLTFTAVGYQHGNGNFSTSISGTGLAPAAPSVSASALIFPSTPLQTNSPPQTVVVTNNSVVPLNFTGITVVNVGIGGFFITGSTCSGFTPAGGSCSISVAFAPPATGQTTGTLGVSGAVSAFPNAATVSTSVSLTGTGIYALPTLSLPALSFAATTINTTSQSQTVTLTNHAAVAVTVASVTATGDYSQTNTCSSSIAASSSCTITVSFTPTTAGTRTGTLTVITTGSAPATLTTSLTGTGTNPLPTLSPSALTFAPTTLTATSVSQTVTVTNHAPVAVIVASVAITGDYSQANTCGTSIPANGTCTVSVAFTPTAASTRSGTLTVTTTGAAPATLIASLTGTGQTPVGPTLSSSSLTFATTTLGTSSAAQIITVTNNAPIAVPVSVVATTGDFPETNTCGTSIPANGTCAISITFTPVISGIRTGTLIVTTAGAAGITLSASLTGTGQADFIPNPTSNPAPIAAGSSATVNLTFIPVLDSSTTITLTCTPPTSPVPTGITCNVPAPFAINGTPVTQTVTITTTSRVAASGLAITSWRGSSWIATSTLGFAGLLMFFAARSRRLGQFSVRITGLLLLLLAVCLPAIGCGGSSPPKSTTTGTTTTNPNGTPAGTYSYTITATATSGATHTETIALTVN